MKKTITITILFTFMCIINSYSQKIPVTIPSPEAANLGIVGNIPVSLHTGRANINIPLMEVKSYNYTLPVNLTYNSSGVMPDTRPTWVGQNWNLEVGGTITRVVKGIPDESDNGFYRRTSNINSVYSTNWYSQAALVNIRTTMQFVNHYNLPQITIDMEPDEFYFNVNGLSGKFCLGSDRKFHVVSNPEIKVEFENTLKEVMPDRTGLGSTATFNNFQITGPDGTIYHFGSNELEDTNETGYLESARTYTSDNSGKTYASSWLLSKIELPDSKETIDFTYTNRFTDTNIFRAVKDEASQWIDYWPNLYSNTSSGLCWHTGGDGSTEVYHRYLKSVEGPNFKMTFHTSAANDLTPASVTYKEWQRLDSIVLRNKANERIKSFQFAYDPNFSRLYLKSVKETGMTAGYTFSYNGNYTAWLSYDTNKLDHWGYLNYYPDLPDDFSQAKDIFRIPIASMIRLTADTAEYYTLNRETNPKFVTSGLLQSISYPTGGSVAFEFEANDYSQYGYMVPFNGMKFKNVKRRWSDSLLTFTGRTVTLPNFSQIWMQFQNYSNTIYEFTAPPGTYSIGDFWNMTGKTGPQDDWSEIPYRNYTMKACYAELAPSCNAYAGGARIKKITHIDGNKEIVREYKYVKNFKLNQPSNLSSGILGTLPLYNYSYSEDGTLITGYYNVASSQSFTENSLTDGSPVGYSEVAEITKDGQGNTLGYTTYKYTNFDSNPDDRPENALSIIARDFYARNKNDMERGKLLSQKEYAANDTMVKQTDYTYQRYTRESSLHGIRCEGLFSNCNWGGMVAYTISAYLIYIKSYLPVSKTETIRDINGQNPVTTQTNYVYDSYNQIRRTEVTSSDNSVRKQEMKYPADFTNAPYPAMFAKHILSPAVETAVYRNSALIEKTASDYALQHNSFYAPVNAKYQKGNGNMEIRETYLYDTKGNIRETAKEDANRTVYLWGYNYQYPVAKIENASYSRVENILTSALINRVASANTPSAADLTAIKNLRTHIYLPEAMVTVYEYEPLIGISKMTDPRGIVTNYIYDHFGRLIQVLVDGKKEKDYQYHYRE